MIPNAIEYTHPLLLVSKNQCEPSGSGIILFIGIVHFWAGAGAFPGTCRSGCAYRDVKPDCPIIISLGLFRRLLQRLPASKDFNGLLAIRERCICHPSRSGARMPFVVGLEQCPGTMAPLKRSVGEIAQSLRCGVPVYYLNQ